MRSNKFYLLLAALFFVLAIMFFIGYTTNEDQAIFACSITCVAMAITNMQGYQIGTLEQEVADLKYRHNVVLVDMRKDR